MRVNPWSDAVGVVEDCLRAGVGEFVVCAGSRNAALLEAITRAESAGLVRVWHHYEERSAGFFALGRILEINRPCAVVTTSGTAAAELFPAIIEAFYQARPLVAITADRPANFRFSGAPQAIDQVGLFGNYAHRTGFSDWNGTRPLHLNVELDEGFSPGVENFAVSRLADFTPQKDRLDVAALARWLREDPSRGTVILIGGLEPDEREDVFHFCNDLGFPLVADATSGLREALGNLTIHDSDRSLKSRPPGKILRLGDVPCGRFWRDLENLPNVSVWSVCRNGLPGLARESNVLRGRLDRVIPALGQFDRADDPLDLLTGSASRAARIEELLETYPDSEPAMMRAISQFASLSSGLFLGNSLPVREWNLFAQWERPVPSVRANRGVNGIDGQLSTWLGWSADVTDAWGIFGDLTTLYDLAGPFVSSQLNLQGRVLVVFNNGGGRIFDRLANRAIMNPQTNLCMTNSHQADFAGFATLWGMTHHRVRTPNDFDHFETAEKMVLLEVIPNSIQTDRFWQAWDRLRQDPAN